MTCRHKNVELKKEKDGCYWMQCRCGARGPKKHSGALARKRYVKVGMVSSPS